MKLNCIKPIETVIAPYNPSDLDKRIVWQGLGFGNAHAVRREHSADMGELMRQAERAFGKRGIKS